MSFVFRFRRPGLGRPVRVGLVAAAVLAAAGATLFAAGPPAMRLAADATDSPITGFTGKRIDVADANTANSTAVQLYDCNGTGAQRWSSPGANPPADDDGVGGDDGADAPAGFLVSEGRFNAKFPAQTYQGLTAALGAYPGFTTTGDDTTADPPSSAGTSTTRRRATPSASTC